MVDWGLLGGGDLRDPAGYHLEYDGADVSYSIKVKDGDEVVEGLGTTEAITGDFLVDPQFFRTRRRRRVPARLHRIAGAPWEEGGAPAGNGPIGRIRPIGPIGRGRPDFRARE